MKKGKVRRRGSIRLMMLLTAVLLCPALCRQQANAASDKIILSKLEPKEYGGDGRGYTFERGKDGGIRAVDGTIYEAEDVVVLDGSHSSWVVYDLNKKYSSFSGKIVTGDSLKDSNCHTGGNKSIDFKIIGDNKVLYEQHGIDREHSGFSFSVDLSNVKTLRLESGNQASYSYGFFFVVNGVLTKNSLKLNEKTMKLNVGDTAYLKYTLKDSSAKASFQSNKKSVAKVSSKGKIVAMGPGVCKITVKVKSQKASCTVIVLPKKVSGIRTIARNKTSLQLKWTKQSGAKGYQVFLYDTDLEEYVRVKTTSSNTALIKNLKKGTSFRFKIRGYVMSGNKKYYGKFSKVFKAKTKK